MPTRQLAAIMFTDIVGYTAMMQSDEATANTAQQRHRAIFDENVAKHHGKVVQYYGDGTLSSFASTIDCVLCAIEIQHALRQPPRIEVRIGIHTGDVILDETGIYGDGVNIASRIESLATPGSIFISERVHDDIRNQSEILTEDMGFFDLKNVKKAVRVYAVANSGIVVPAKGEVKGKTRTAEQTLAVLPFLNLSGDQENEYFSDGVTEELINAFTAIEGLNVISRTTAFAFKGRNEDIRNIGAQLNVSKLLEGSVRKAGNRVRITAQLINAADGFHIWSETFDRDLTDIFKVQDEISHIIANKLRAKLLPEGKTDLLVRAPTQNLDAYSLFLKGKFHQNKETPADVVKAMEYFQQAIEMQPDFALAYAHLCGCYALLAGVGAMPAREAYAKVTELSNLALRLNDELGEAYIARALAYMYFEWNWDAAYAALMKAQKLLPGSNTILWVLGYYYLIIDDPKKAIEVLEQTWRLDPLAMEVTRALSFAYFYALRFDDTIRLGDMQLDVMPENWFAISTRAFCYGMKGDWEKALSEFNRAHAISGGAPMILSYQIYTLGRLGRNKEAQEKLKQLEEFQAANPDLARYIDNAIAYWGMGNRDASFDNIFKAIEQQEELVSMLINSPLFVDIKSDPRYKDARKRMHFNGFA